MAHSHKKFWAGALAALLALFAAVVVATPAWATTGGSLALTKSMGTSAIANAFAESGTGVTVTETPEGSGNFTVDLSDVGSPITLAQPLVVTGDGCSLTLQSNTQNTTITTSGKLTYGSDSGLGSNTSVITVGAKGAKGPTVSIGNNVVVQNPASNKSEKAVTVNVISGTLNVNDGGTVSSTSAPEGGNSDAAAIMALGGTVNVYQGGTVKASQVGIRTNGTNAITSPATINVEGGTVTGDVAGMYLPQSTGITGNVDNTVTISSEGSVSGPVGIVNQGSTVNVNEGGSVVGAAPEGGGMPEGSIGSGGISLPDSATGVVNNAGASGDASYGTSGELNVSGGSVEGGVINRTTGKTSGAEPAVTVSNGGTVDTIDSSAGTVTIDEGGTVTGDITSTGNDSQIILNSGATVGGSVDNQGTKPVQDNGAEIGGTVTGPVKPGSSTDGNNWVPATVTSIGFVGDNNEIATSRAAADKAIVAALGLDWADYDGKDVAGGTTEKLPFTSTYGDDNVLWAIVKGSPNGLYGFQWTRTNATGDPALAFSTLNDGIDVNPVKLDSKGVGVVWIAMDATNSICDASVNGGTVKSVCTVNPVRGTIAGTYNANAWPANYQGNKGLGTGASVSVTGVNFVSEAEDVNNNNIPNNSMYGQEGSAITLLTANGAEPAGVTNPSTTIKNQAVTGWVLGSASAVAPGSSYTLPAPAGIGANYSFVAQWGTEITLSLAGNTNFEAAKGVSFATLTPSGDLPYTKITTTGNTYVIGAAEGGTIPELPVLVPNNSSGSVTQGENVFVGWFVYDTTAKAYVAVNAGDAISSLPIESGEPVTLYPIVTTVELAWTPASPSLVIGSTGSYTVSATMGDEVTDTNIAAKGVTAVPAASEDATALFNALVSSDLSQAYKAPQTPTDANKASVTGLQNVLVSNTPGAWKGANLSPKNVAVTTKLWDTSCTIDVTLDPAYQLVSNQGNSNTNTVWALALLPSYGMGQSVSVTSDGKQLSIAVKPPVQVTVSPAGAGTVQQSVNANNSNLMDLTAVANNGYKFVKWTNGNGATLSENPTYTVKQNPTDIALPITAVFESSQVAVERLYNPYDGEHLVSASPTEIEALEGYGWENEGVAWYAPNTGIAVYRLYNPYSHDHYYTTKLSEYESLQSLGWQKDNNGEPVFYGSTISNYPVYQLFNPYEQVGTHLWTTSVEEYDAQAKLGWVQENVVWYAANLPATNPAA